MKQHILNWISCLFLALFILSCKKNKGALADMKKGKYEMINIRTFSNGQKDTINCIVYGPRILKYHHYFSPEIGDDLVDEIDININRRVMFAGGSFPKGVESWSIRFYSNAFSSPGYFGGSVDSYDMQESELVINYSATTTNYTSLQEEIVYTGSVKFNWIEL
ncbi:hypothetical protein [Fluviicola taffensis]|uniref:Lipoprotein n=1 Tax=Fluviicola taffensis (strain DSM 16823 / NCIMB 13979 / RW262) TaxID=755732 RepID=F2IIZ0_FLUTR|nr:hypothetical protein [Fluviicola taffensis]AEA43848.1 hypothetical protein Fluta_1861 [Fluviicola taffensis DSM 16823]